MTTPLPWTGLVSADDHADCLVEALRRWLCFGVMRDGMKSSEITRAWTGLGSRVAGYGRMEKFGLMEIAAGDNAPYASWWKLTPRGAAIILRWIEEGFEAPGYQVQHKTDPKRRPLIPKAYLRTPS